MYRAFSVGLRDGVETPYHLGVGMSYDDDAKQQAYDRGVNIGQACGQLWGTIRRTARTLWTGGRVSPG